MVHSFPNRISIVGAGGWGTALANLLANNGLEILIWAYEPEVVEEINSSHTNQTYLEGITLSSKVKATNDLDEIFKFSHIILSSVPTQYIRNVYRNHQLNLEKTYVINVAKGIEQNTYFRCSEIFADLGVTQNRYAILTGPSHAEEVARLVPTTVVVSSPNLEFALFVQQTFSNENFRVYTSTDTIGCEFGGSLKNIIAIASGIIDGLKFGDNTKAALITRGLAEMNRLAVAFGANPQTMSGLAGLGDLFVTCNSPHSRNRRVGELIGQGKNLDEIINSMKMIAEGVASTKSVYELSRKINVEMPIVQKVYEILFENLNPLIAIKQLMTRASKNEWW